MLAIVGSGCLTIPGLDGEENCNIFTQPWRLRSQVTAAGTAAPVQACRWQLLLCTIVHPCVSVLVSSSSLRSKHTEHTRSRAHTQPRVPTCLQTPSLSQALSQGEGSMYRLGAHKSAPKRWHRHHRAESHSLEAWSPGLQGL